jgi:hypothetical protein
MYQVKIKKLPNLPQARRGGSYLNYYQMAPSFTSDSLSDAGLSYSKTLGPVDRDVANVEVEKKEQIAMNGGEALGGMLTMYEAGGKRHAQGGTPLNLPEGAFVFSDFHGKDFRLGGNTKTKEMDKGILAYFGLPDRKGGYTFADIAAKYDINKDVANLMDPTEVKDKMTMDTLMLNIKNKTKKLGALAIAQESKKGEAAPKIAMPFITAMNMAPEDFDIPKISIDEMPFYQNIMKGAQEMDQQKAMQQQQQEAQAAGMDMQDQGQPQGQMSAPDQASIEEQYAQDMGQYMQRMGGSSFPNPYYPGRIPEEMPQAMLGYQVFKQGGETGLDKFLFMAKRGIEDFDPDNIVNRTYNRRKGVYIYTDASGNKFETTQADLAVAGMQGGSGPLEGGPSIPPEQTTPAYDIPKDAVVVERKKDESAEDWAKRKQEAYDKAVDKGRVYIKSEDKYYRVGNRKKGYGEYKGSAEELKRVFNDNKDLAAMYQKLEETFKDPKIRAEYVKRVREAVKNDENLGDKAKGDFKTKILNGTIKDEQIVQAFLDHNKRNIGFAAHKRNVGGTPQGDATLVYTSADLDKWSKEMGLDIKKDNVMLEQLSYIGYRDLINDKDKIADADVKSKLAPFQISQFGKNDEITALGLGQVSDSDEYYMNTTAGQVASIDPGTELYDEQLKLKKEAEMVPPGEMGDMIQRPPAKPWLQNIIGTGMALTQDVNRYMPIRTTVPYIGQVDPQFISPVYQTQAATSTARGMMEGMAPYMGDQIASSRQSQLFGEVADKAAQAAAGVEQFNAGEATKTNATNLGVRLQGAQAQAAADNEYNTNVIGSKAIFDKNLQLKNVNIYANTVATLDNMARTDAANYVFGDEFNINGMNPFNPIQQIRGKSPNGQVSADAGGSLMAAYQAALKNPDFAGMDKEDIKDLVIAEYNKSAYANAASSRKKTLANSIMGAYMSPVAANNPMMNSLSAYTQGMNPYTNAPNDQAF